MKNTINFFKNTIYLLKYKIIFFVILFSGLGSNIDLNAQKISRNDFIKDLETMKFNLEKHHLGLYYYQSKESFENKYNDIVASLGDSVNKQETYILASNLISEVRDLHTSISRLKPNKKALILPLGIRRFGKDFFVSSNGSQDTTIMRGLQILKIENDTPARLFEEFTHLYGADNNNPSSQSYYAERSFNRYYYHTRGQKDSIAVTFKNLKKDSVYTKYIKSLTAKEMNAAIAIRYKNLLTQNFKFKILDSVNRIASLSITSFSFEAHALDFLDLKFKRQLKKVFKTVKEKNIEHLVIDFRGNGGGRIKNISRLTKYVSKENFELSDSIIMNKASYRLKFPIYSVFPFIVSRIMFKKFNENVFAKVAPQIPRITPNHKYHFDKKLYVIMDGGSYSATSFTIGLWKDMNLATFIGTPAGGANWGSYAGQWKNQKLKHSQLSVRIPLYKIVYSQKNRSINTFVVEPDYYVKQSFKDFLWRVDSQEKFVINLIKNQKL